MPKLIKLSILLITILTIGYYFFYNYTLRRATSFDSSNTLIAPTLDTVIDINKNLNSNVQGPYEVNLNQMYKEYSNIVYKLEEPMKVYEFQKDITKIIDLLIKIIKTSPESAEAYHALASFPISLDIMDDEPKHLFLSLEKKYIDNLSIPLEDPAEKLVFMMLTKSHPSEFRFTLSEETDQSKYEKCINGLQLMANCQNKSYAALATTELFDRAGTGITHDYRKSFLNSFPTHPAIPHVKLILITDYYAEEKYQTCIEETKKLCEEYKDFLLPDGWKFEISCYELLAMCYIELKDLKTASKYYQLICEKAPTNPQIFAIKQQLDAASNNNPSIK